MSLTCFPTENIYLNHTNANGNHEQTNANSNLINSTTNQFRNKLINQSADNLNLSTTAPVHPNNLTNNSNVIQNSKSDLMISGFDSFPLSRTTTPIPYLTNSSLDGYFSTLGTPNPQLNSQLNSHLNRCHSSNSNCSTNSKLNNSSLISSRPASSFDNFLSINNDSDDSTQANSNHTNQSAASSNQSHTAPIVPYYPHINFNNNSINDALNAQQHQSNATPTIHHSSNFHSSSNQGVKEEYLDNQANNYSNAINFNNSNDVQILSNSSSSNLNSSLNDSTNRMQLNDNEVQSTSKTNGLTGKKRRNKINGGQPSRPQCSDCGKDFSNQSALSKHKLTHSDERKFVCPLCSKGFKRNDHLNGHLYTHRDKKPYQCDINNCEKTYCDARSLKRHKENHHSIFSQLAIPLLGKGLSADLASNILSAVKTTDGSRIKYAPASNENSNNELTDLDLNNAYIDTNLLDLSDKSQNALIQQIINEVDSNGSAALSILQQHIAEQQSNYVECPTCQKKFKNLPALNGHMRLHGGFYRGGNQQPINENTQRQNTAQAPTADQSINDKNDQLNDSPIDLIKKESLFVDLTNQNNQQQSIQTQSNSTDLNSNIIKDKIRKHIANTPVIIENPEANRFQQQQQQQIINDNSRVHYYSQNDTSQNNNLLSTSVINNNNPYSTTNKSPLIEHQQLQLDNHPSPNNKLIQQQNEQDLLNNNQEKQVVHENSWFEDPNNVLHLKEQLQQQFRTPVNSISNKIINQQQHQTQLKPNLLNRPAAIPSHVFTNGEKFRRHSDSTAEILNQNMNQTNYVNHHHQANNAQLNQQQMHSQVMNQTTIHQPEPELQPMNYETNNLNSQIKNNNDLINFDYIKRKMPQHRVENESNIETNMETIPESQIINSTTNTNYLSNHLQVNNNHHVSFYNNCNNTGNQLAYQSHSVPTTPTVNQNFFSNQRIDLNRANQQLNHDYSQLNNGNNQLSHHSNQHLSVNNQQHSLPCTPKQPTSFTFSPHQVQHYQQQNQTSYHNSHYNSSPNTPITPNTPLTPASNCGNQYQDNLIMQRTNLHAPQPQTNQLTVEYNNNTICPRDKYGQVNQQQNLNSYNNMINNQYLDSNDNLNNVDHLNNNYPTIINDNYLVNENNSGYNEPQQQQHDQQTQFSNCQMNNNYQVNNVICPNTNNTSNRTNYPQQQLTNTSNVIISNYTANDENAFCENNLMSGDNLNKNNLDDLNASLNNNDKQMIVNNCQQQQQQQPQHQQHQQQRTSINEITPEKYTRVTLRSNSPTLIIETESYKNSTADDSQPFSNLNDDPEDDVFLAPTSPVVRSISSPKTNFAYKKPKSSTQQTAGNTFLGRVNNSYSTMNHSLPQVDFTHPQQPKSVTNKVASLNLNKKDELKKQQARVEDDQVNDINFNSIKVANNNIGYGNLNKTRTNDKQIVDRNNSPKRKHRPEPLYIPPHVNARSKTANAHYRILPALIDNNPPYTPPPMLSPVRTNSSYYYYILSGQVTPRTMANILDNPKTMQQHQAAILNNQTNAMLNKGRSFDFFNAANQNDILTPATAYEPLDSSLPVVEPTFDFSSPSSAYLNANAHVNIGTAYQARIPAFNPNKEEAKLHYKNEKADKLWDPKILDNLTFSNSNDEFRQFKSATNPRKKANQTKKDLDLYLDLSCSACIVGAGRNREYAYHILYQNNGDLNKSIKQLLNSQPVIKPDHPLYNYKYAETDTWTCEEIQLYYEALIKYDKDFSTISKQLENKSVKQCIEFYYLWKKVCSEEYRKHRQLRRKKEQEGISCK